MNTRSVILRRKHKVSWLEKVPEYGAFMILGALSLGTGGEESTSEEEREGGCGVLRTPAFE